MAELKIILYVPDKVTWDRFTLNQQAKNSISEALKDDCPFELND